MKHNTTYSKIFALLLAATIIFAQASPAAFAAEPVYPGVIGTSGVESVTSSDPENDSADTEGAEKCTCPLVDSGTVVHLKDCSLYTPPEDGTLVLSSAATAPVSFGVSLPTPSPCLPGPVARASPSSTWAVLPEHCRSP